MHLSARVTDTSNEERMGGNSEQRVTPHLEDSKHGLRNLTDFAWPGTRGDELDFEAEYAGAFGVPHNVVRVIPHAGTLYLKVFPTEDDAFRLKLVDDLTWLIENNAANWDWSLDLSNLRHVDLYLLDHLVNLGMQLKSEERRFTIQGLDLSPITPVFRKMFLVHCAKHDFCVET